MRVVWDVKKAAANIRNHGIEFSHAATVLDDPMAVTIEDTRHPGGTLCKSVFELKSI